MGLMWNRIDDFIIVADSNENAIQPCQKVIVIPLPIADAIPLYICNQQWDENDFRQ